MRASLALAVVCFSTVTFASPELGFDWLVRNANLETLQVQGSEALGLEREAPMQDVLDEISRAVGDNLYHVISADLCRKSYGNVDVRCSVIFADTYLLEYNLAEEDGRYEVLSPARIFKSN